jgi:Icc-related predicted phosphoesterase
MISKKVVYTADFHGNVVKYKKLVDYAIRNSADFVIIGGDLTPKRVALEMLLETQRKFIEKTLPELVAPLKKERPKSRLFLMMGNDDAAANMDVLQKNNNNLYEIIHDKRIQLTDKIDIIGYSFVPITPFGIKDWEKFDTEKMPDGKVSFAGIKSTKKGWYPFVFTEGYAAKDSIKKDLENERFRKNANNTIYVMHAPPYNTNLDKMWISKDFEIISVGSTAVRDFIEELHPFLTLHGHIHETVDVTDEFNNRIGKTLSMAPGNYDTGKTLALIEFELEKPEYAKRIKI